MRITGFVGLFTDPGHIVVSAGGDQIRQQFVVCFHAWLRAGTPRPDHQETSDAAWFDPDDVAALPLEPGACRLIRHALSGAREPISTEERMAMKTLLGPWE